MLINRIFLSIVMIALVQSYSCLPSFAGKFQTDEPPQMETFDTNNGWEVTPLVTIGETNEKGEDVNEKKLGYRPLGKLDGIGAFKSRKSLVRVLMNHELGGGDGYAYELSNGTQLTGARVSFFDIHPKTRKVKAAGIAYDTVFDRSGTIVTDPEQIHEGEWENLEGFSNLCSAYAVNAGEFGFVDNSYFAGEEVGGVVGGQQSVIDVDNRDMYVVPMMGRAAHENACPLDPGDSNKVALMIGDDRVGASLLLYIGQKGVRPRDVYPTIDPIYAPPDFLVRNGLGFGNLYVFVSDDGYLDPADFNGNNANSMEGKFVKLREHFDPAKGDMIDYDSMGFCNLQLQDTLADGAGAFMFSRPEDISVNPNNGTQVVLASTGNSVFAGGADRWGTIYRIDVHLDNILLEDLRNINNIPATVEIMYDGDNNKQFGDPDLGLRSPDNLDWADDGFIYIQEDNSLSAFGQTSTVEASIWQLNSNVGDQPGQLVRLLEMDRSAIPLGQTDSTPSDFGNWESSGIVDVTELFRHKKSEQVFLFDVQAHSLEGTLLGNLDGNIVPAGSTWKYLDDGTDQGKAWRRSSFDDTDWKEGPAELGYGDGVGSEATVVSFGPDRSNKCITTYFRHTFDITGTLNINNLSLKILRDDGAVLYLNGKEIYRTNMPAGKIPFDTPASSAVGGSDEDTFFETSVNPGLLKEGKNVLAVEIHQVSGTSSDISFDLELSSIDLGQGGQLLFMSKKN